MNERQLFKSEIRAGAVKGFETLWGTYTIYERGGKAWIEASGWGGAQKRMPRVNSVEEAEKVVKQHVEGSGHEPEPITL